MPLHDFQLGPRFCLDAFPFHLILYKDLSIHQVGDGLRKLIPAIEPGKDFQEFFLEHDSAARLSYDEIESRISSTFHFQSQTDSSIEIEGGFYSINDSYLLFLAHPIIRQISDIAKLSLKFGDFSHHSSTLNYISILQAKEALRSDSNALVHRLETLVERRTKQLQRRTVALEESEAMFKQAARTARLGHWSFDETSGEFLSLSEEYARIFGYTVDGFLKYHATLEQDIELVHPEDRARVAEAYEMSGDVDVEYRIVRVDGSVRTVVETSKPLPDSPNGYSCDQGTLQDITKLRRVQEQTRELQDAKAELTRALADAHRAARLVKLGTYVWDWTEDRLAACSEEYARLHELSVEDTLAASHSSEADYNFVHPDDRERYAAIEVGAIARGEGFTAEYRKLLPSGRTYHVREVCEVELNDQGEVIRSLGSLQDVSEQVELEEKVRTRDVWLRGILDNTPIEIVIKDNEGRVMAVSRNAVEAYGGSEEELIGGTSLNTLPAPVARTYKAADQCVAETGQSVQQEVREEVDGVMRYSLNAKFPLKDTQGEIQGICSMTSDITDMKETEARLSQSQKMEAVGTLAGGIAHDFNNLLTVIEGYDDLLLEGIKTEDPMYHGLNEIRKASDRAASLTRQLLAFSRKQILQPKVIDIGEIVAEIEIMLRRLIGEHIELDVRRDPDLQMVMADPGQMDQVIMNLMVNARDAMPQGGSITISIENVALDDRAGARLDNLPTGEYVMLSLSDSGVGMDEETMTHIFEPFYTTKEAEKGTGLGLSTVFGIVKQSGGGIEVQSELGKGSTFRIFLPQVEVSESVAEGREGFASPGTGCETIMIVEDEEMIRTLLERILETFGYNILTAQQGAEALLIAEQHEGPIDLMITDVVMPQMGGHELAERIAPLRPEMSVLYISGYDEQMVSDHGLVDPERRFLQKPFLPKEIARKIREILDNPVATDISISPEPASSQDHISPG